MNECVELYIRFGEAEDGPREVQTYVFATASHRQAFIDGLRELATNHAGTYDICVKLENGMFEADPLWDDEWEVAE